MINKEIYSYLEETKSICRAIRKNMKYESTFDLNTLKLNKNNEEAIGNLLQYIDQLETDKQKLIGYIEKKIGEYDETIIELVLQNILTVAKGEKGK